MFTGIIEDVGEVTTIISNGNNRTFWIKSSLSASLKVDQSIAHDGVCLTVEEIDGSLHRVTAIAETLKKSNLQSWTAGKFTNLERSLLPTNRLDGHFVQGHVDATATCKKIRDKNGSYELTFSFDKKFAPLVIEKGSIAVNGISLTVFNVKKGAFSVGIIPYTFEHTNLQYIKENDLVNLEFDMIGKYIQRKLSLK